MLEGLARIEFVTQERNARQLHCAFAFQHSAPDFNIMLPCTAECLQAFGVNVRLGFLRDAIFSKHGDEGFVVQGQHVSILSGVTSHQLAPRTPRIGKLGILGAALHVVRIECFVPSVDIQISPSQSVAKLIVGHGMILVSG